MTITVAFVVDIGGPRLGWGGQAGRRVERVERRAGKGMPIRS